MDELTTRLAEALRRLDTAQMVYRKNHDLYGDGRLETGCAWDKLRAAGQLAQVTLNDYDSALAAEQREAVRVARRIAEEEAEQERRDNGQFGVGA